jgi:hypothetical protein
MMLYLQNALRREAPAASNKKYTPKSLYSDSPVSKWLHNADLQDLWIKSSAPPKSKRNVNDDMDDVEFWTVLAAKGRAGAFQNNVIFRGLCDVLCNIAERKAKGKGMQNLHYPEAFNHFLVVLATISPRAYDLFRTNLAGRTIRSIRYYFIYYC